MYSGQTTGVISGLEFSLKTNPLTKMLGTRGVNSVGVRPHIRGFLGRRRYITGEDLLEVSPNIFEFSLTTPAINGTTVNFDITVVTDGAGFINVSRSSFTQTLKVNSGRNHLKFTLPNEAADLVTVTSTGTNFLVSHLMYFLKVQSSLSLNYGGPRFTVQPKLDPIPYLGDTVVLTAEMVSQASVEYQWQANGLDIMGETSNTISHNFTSTADVGVELRCKCTTGGRSYLSDAVTLIFRSINDNLDSCISVPIGAYVTSDAGGSGGGGAPVTTPVETEFSNNTFEAGEKILLRTYGDFKEYNSAWFELTPTNTNGYVFDFEGSTKDGSDFFPRLRVFKADPPSTNYTDLTFVRGEDATSLGFANSENFLSRYLYTLEGGVKYVIQVYTDWPVENTDFAVLNLIAYEVGPTSLTVLPNYLETQYTLSEGVYYIQAVAPIPTGIDLNVAVNGTPVDEARFFHSILENTSGTPTPVATLDGDIDGVVTITLNYPSSSISPSSYIYYFDTANTNAILEDAGILPGSEWDMPYLDPAYHSQLLIKSRVPRWVYELEPSSAEVSCDITDPTIYNDTTKVATTDAETNLAIYPIEFLQDPLPAGKICNGTCYWVKDGDTVNPVASSNSVYSLNSDTGRLGFRLNRDTEGSYQLHVSNKAWGSYTFGTITLNYTHIYIDSDINPMTLNVAFTQTLSTQEAEGAVTWATESGAWPTGVSLNAGTGEVSGTPTESGEFTVTVSATDTYPKTDTKTFTFTIHP